MTRAGVLGTLAFLGVTLQQGLLWLVLYPGELVLHVFWFWRRVLWRNAARSESGEDQGSLLGSRRSSRKRVLASNASSKEGEQERKERADGVLSAATVLASVLRQRKADRISRGTSTEDREVSMRSRCMPNREKDAEREGGRETYGDKEAEADSSDERWFDSADEADSEAEQDSLLPAAERRRRLPRKMSFPSLNLAAGCFPPEANMKHSIISACLYTPNLPTTKAVLQLIEGRLLNFYRFRSVPIVSGFYPRWHEVSVHPASHVRRLQVRGTSELHLCTEWIMCQPCDENKPRWQVWLIENSVQQQQQQHTEHIEIWDSRDYRTAEERQGVSSRIGINEPGRHCIVVRAEHCIGDGVSLVELGMRLLTDAKGLPLNEWENPPILKVQAMAADEHLCNLPSPTAHLLRWTKMLMRTPRRIADALWGGLLLLLGSLRTIGAAILNGRDAYTPITGSAAIRDHLQWCSRALVGSSPPVSLDLVREIRKASNATLNDIFLSAFTGAFKRYCLLQGDTQFSNGDSVSLPKVLMACAFFRRTKELPDTSQLLLRNRFTLTSVELPADSKDSKETLRRVKESTSALKRSRQAAADFICQRVLGNVLPRRMVRKAAEGLFSTHSVVFSNLPAYTAPVHFCGSEITEVHVLYPNLIPQVEVVSYANRVFFSFIYNPSIVTEGHRIPGLFVEELYRLADAVGVPRSIHLTEKQKQLERYSEKLGKSGASSPTASNSSGGPTI